MEELLHLHKCLLRVVAVDVTPRPWPNRNNCPLNCLSLPSSSVHTVEHRPPFKPYHHQVAWTLRVVKDRLHPALLDTFLLSEEQPAVNSDDALHYPCAESHQAPDDAKIFLCISPVSFVPINHFICKVTRAFDNHLAIQWIL